MNLCFERKVEKRQGASCIRRLLEEAWSTEGMWDTYLWIKLNGIVTYRIAQYNTSSLKMSLLMLCRIFFLYSLRFQAKMVSTLYTCSIADWNKEKEHFVFCFPYKLKWLILKFELFRVIFYTTDTCKLMLSFVQKSFLASKITLHA